MSIGVHVIAAHYLLNQGTEEQKRRCLPRMAGSSGVTPTAAVSAVRAHRGTEGSNPFPSSGESTNCRYPVGSASRLRDAPRGQWRQGGREIEPPSNTVKADTEKTSCCHTLESGRPRKLGKSAPSYWRCSRKPRRRDSPLARRRRGVFKAIPDSATRGMRRRSRTPRPLLPPITMHPLPRVFGIERRARQQGSPDPPRGRRRPHSRTRAGSQTCFSAHHARKALLGGVVKIISTVRGCPAAPANPCMAVRTSSFTARY